MFASTMHSVADAVNQGLVFVGSVMAERKPTRKFPTGFGRVINLVCMVAVLVVTMMAYETICEGWHLIQHPATVTSVLWDVIALGAAILVDGYVLHKAMHEIAQESRVEARGVGLLVAAFRHAGQASPPTRLMFYEDLVATLGALFALVAILVSNYTEFKVLDGGCRGADRVAELIFADPDVTDTNKMRIVQEGRNNHSETYIELMLGFSLADADDIKLRVRDLILRDHDVSDVTLGILEDDGVRNWLPEEM
ncbi:divalent metal cation (Fe/Co/Zn/Cd) transporter [Tumebacillus permanentifrigoris]|uniref:Divalent metal cation (Fe/Co/Zn/Cd) transporter n=1 Tax=Tumebacillus permanentifrigoris TaxID=378543 RepID=A0A316D5T2_9BACL|nr:divalent metal cation (Fe/Co/Zn/Cd) transporter [Tumebacillus permanentifrigoris]